MTVKHCKLTASCVSEYDGSEVPDAARFGWKSGTRYRLYRDAESLKQATPGLEGKPLLLQHKPVTAADHPKSLTVGSIANPSYENGEVCGDLVIWSQDAIDAVENKELPAVSLGYRYRLDPTPGTTPTGERYDGRMLDIAMNHCALVESPRVEGALVADSAKGFARIGRKIGQTSTRGIKMQQKISRAFGLDDSRCRGRDAELLSKLDGPKVVPDDGEEENPAAAKVLALLKGKLSPEEMQELVALLGEMDEGEGEEEGGRADRDPRKALARHDNYEEDEEEVPGLRQAEKEDRGSEMHPNGRERSRHCLDDERPVGATSLKENLRRVARNLLNERPGRRPPESGAGAMDAAALASFRARFPGSARIDGSGTGAFCFGADGAPRYRERQPAVETSADFFMRYPGAKRIQR